MNTLTEVLGLVSEECGEVNQANGLIDIKVEKFLKDPHSEALRQILQEHLSIKNQES